MEKYRKIVDDLIDKSFPILKKKKIFVCEVWMFKHYSGSALYLPPFKILLFSRRLRNRTKCLNGIIAHELGHFELIIKRGFIRSFLVVLFYWFNKKLRRREEEIVNKLIIRRGYAKEIYAASKNVEDLKRKAGVIKYYMSAEQIKSYAQKIRKW